MKRENEQALDDLERLVSQLGMNGSRWDFTAELIRATALAVVALRQEIYPPSEYLEDMEIAAKYLCEQEGYVWDHLPNVSTIGATDKYFYREKVKAEAKKS